MTAGEQEIVAALQPLWTATPDVVGRWRQFGGCVTGVHAADYESDAPGTGRLAVECQRLFGAAGRAIWVEEPGTLGGFGLRGPAGRYNADTLRFLRVLLLLQDAALLAEFRGRQSRRPIVWEIGGGWGGFAQQFKTLHPDVTYLITAPAELVLLSAVYLATACPGARLRFYDPARPATFWSGWEDVDFAFAPDGIVGEPWPVSLDLAVDLAMLERMSAERIRVHVDRAHAAGARYLVSECPSAAVGAADLRALFETRYWSHPVSVPRFLGKRLALSDPARTYFLGWRRLLV
jgi:hypothetical protein